MQAEWREFASEIADRYTVISELGRGGMAVVLLAHDVRHDRELALKLFRSDVSAAMAAERFEREIRVAARLNHPHIVPLFDSGAAAGFLYYVMPFVRGESLRQRLDREGQLDADQAVRIGTEICGALDYAHRAGIVHRDIKPENILLSEGHALVADFGIAHAIDVSAGNRLTTIGLTVGTPAYMSPEQAGGEAELDGRSDQYSTACVIFELLTGRVPFGGPTAMAFLAQHLTQEAPSVSALRPDVPPHIERALRRALEKAPDHRFASASELASALSAPPVATPQDEPENSIVVLDFLNLSGDSSVQWLSSGIAETLGVDLGRIGSVRIVRRERVARVLAGRSQPVTSEEDALGVARALGARRVVWGAYQAAGDRIRVTLRVGNVAAGSMLSSMKLDGAMGEIFDLQDRLVADILARLDIDVSEQQRAVIAKPATNSLTAYELFARARQLQHQFTPAALLESRALLHEAIERDPDFALAHSGLGFSYAFGFIGSSNPADLTSALTHLALATTLDSGLGEAHAWQAYALGRSGRYDEAIAAGERAALLEPDFGMAHYLYGLALYLGAERGPAFWPLRGRAVQAFLNAARVDPGSQSTYHPMTDLYLMNGQYDDAAVPVERALEIEAGHGRTGIAFVGALVLDGVLALRTGDIERAQQQLQLAVTRYDASTHLYAQVHVAMAHRGLAEVARRRGRFDEALIAAHAAIEICRNHPQQVGTGFTLVRAHALAAKASRSLGVFGAVRDELAEAERLLTERTGYAFMPIHEAHEGIAAFDCASAHALAGDVDGAMSWLERAWNAGWNDHPSLVDNPDFARMRDLPAFTAFIARCRRRSRHPAPGPSCDGRLS
jgi:serine/threonine-protein kinase